MNVTFVLALMVDTLSSCPARLLGFSCSLTSLAWGIGSLFAAVTLSSQSFISGLSRLRNTANKISSRMLFLRLNETELSEQCSLAAIHLFEDRDPPVLTRDRVSKILMNRQDVPAKSAARIITHAELTVL